MFKSKKKKQLEKQQKAKKDAILAQSVKTSPEYKLLDDIKLSNDFRSSVILSQLGKERTFHNNPPVYSTNEIKPPPAASSAYSTNEIKSPPATPSVNSTNEIKPPTLGDASKQYKELANWRHQRNQNRYSNSLFGGKQRGKLTPSQLKKSSQSYDEDKLDPTHKDLFIIPPSLNQTIDNSPIETKEIPEDYQFEQDEYEPDSDEENFFFKDFSTDSPRPKQNTRRKRKSNKVNQAFDLSSFAKDLHDHRLSVIQPRQSRIVMTEDDEEELERLLQLQRQRMSIMTINESTESLPPPPMPSLDKVKQFSAPYKTEQFVNEKINNKELSSTGRVNDLKVSLEKNQQKANDIKKSIENDIKESIEKPQRVKNAKEFFMDSEALMNETPPLAAPKPLEEIPFIKKDEAMHISIEPPSLTKIHRAPSLTKHPYPKPHEAPSFNRNNQYEDSNKIALDDEDIVIEAVHKPKMIEQPMKRSISTASILTPLPSQDVRTQKPRRSSSMDHIPFDETSVTSAALNCPKQVPSLNKPKSRGLFGSLRQVSRSKTTHHVNQGMSRAAMAVIQHNEQEQKKQTDILSQFISRASPTKRVNMNDQKRNEVVRRTIIYVQPDSLHQLLKNGGVRNTVMSEESQEEYITATKISRQTSVRKKIVEEKRTKRYQLQSMDVDDVVPPPAQRPDSSSSSSSDASYMEGVELREMSDGSVMWGIVKKQGNRKSFFAHNKNQFEFMEEEEEEVRSPPPIPKRSPHRQPSNRRKEEEVYYSNNVTLPHLLKLVNEQYPGDIHSSYLSEKSMDSVDDQLDEMIKIISSQK